MTNNTTSWSFPLKLKATQAANGAKVFYRSALRWMVNWTTDREIKSVPPFTPQLIDLPQPRPLL
jgi:hypothetical protein